MLWLEEDDADAAAADAEVITTPEGERDGSESFWLLLLLLLDAKVDEAEVDEAEVDAAEDDPVCAMVAMRRNKTNLWLLFCYFLE